MAPYTPRRDEIGAFAQALVHHFELVRRQQDIASQQQAEMEDRLTRQESFRQESLSFQARIAEIVQGLEGHAGRMSTASDNLVSISSQADARAAASAQSTQRVSGHVDVVASSIRDIAQTLAEVVGEAERTSEVAAAARNLVAAAKSDVGALTEAARTIEPVIGLIEDVANQTNLLALNATIEAARAGEMGRGFGVVAHEVKQLATRTARATEEVRSGLQGISAASVRIVERVGKLVDSIEQVDAVAAAIANSMRRQDSNSQMITSNTGKAAADVREVAATVKSVAAMIADAKQAADLVTRASADLGRQAADLKAAVVRFIDTTERIAA
jgi:methyl-accepting chemotaxis protein